MERNLGQLKEEFPWLRASPFPNFGVGCAICSKFFGEGRKLKGMSKGGKDWRSGTVTSYLALQRRKLQKHGDSLDHARAAGSVRIEDGGMAPTSKEFEAVLKHCRKSPIGVSGIADVGGQKKCRKLLWCIAEAHREKKRGFFKSSVKDIGVDGCTLVQSTSIFQDARHGKLTLRYTTGNSKLERNEGFFGIIDLAKSFSLDSVGLMKGTMAILRNFCTRFHNPPHLEQPQSHTASIDLELFANVVASIEVFVSDAASDEIRAGHMLARQSTAMEYQPRLPSLRVVVRDKPHAVRRNLTRGWKADPFLDEVANRFVFQTQSPTRMIQHSDAFKSWFANAVKQIDPALSAVALKQHITDLGFAAHRFESAAKPMSRAVLFFHAFLGTTARVATERRTEEEGRKAAEFLEWLSIEKCLQFAMLSDCALENLELTRLLDCQGFPIEELHSYLSTFKKRMRAMFVGNRPGCASSGCCSHMLKVLQRQVAFRLPGGAAGGKDVVVGSPQGVSDAVFQRCLDRMRNWISIMEATIDAEFPHFEVMQSFAIFNIKGAISWSDEWRRSCFRNLSKLLRAFGCPDETGAPQEQFERLWFVAKRIQEDEGGSSLESWVAACRRVTRTHSKVDVSAIIPVLVRYLGAGASTSGVEQSFTQAEKLYDNLQIISHVNDVVEAGESFLSAFFHTRFYIILMCALGAECGKWKVMFILSGMSILFPSGNMTCQES